MTEIILASQSPRRKDILTRMGIGEFKVVPSNYDEKLDESRDTKEVAMELALGKAHEVAKRYPNAIVIGSDTIVGTGQGRQMEKPKDLEDARAMLLELSGGESFVTTGVAIINASEGIELVDQDTAMVYFYPDSPKISQIREEYLATGDWHDKAGGYGIQSGAAQLIERIAGDYDNIVGLPSRLTADILGKLGIKAYTINDNSL